METELEYLKSCLESVIWNVQQKDAMLKEAWSRIDYLEGREAYLIGKLFDALHEAGKVEAGRRKWIQDRLKEEGIISA